MASRSFLKPLDWMQRLTQQVLDAWHRPFAERLHLMHGQTMHYRRGSIENRFVYPVFYLRLDLMHPPKSHGLFGYNRLRPIAFLQKDHADGKTDLLTWFRHQLQQANLAEQFELGRLELTTQPRVLGYVFNPVSFWAAYDTDDQLRVILCEVNNTFGVRLSYLLTAKNCQPIESKTVLQTYKQLHVSPFFAVSGDYQFRFDLTEQRQQLRIDHFNQSSASQTQPDLATSLSLNALPISQQHIVSSLLHYGWSTALVVVRIHWQAIKIWKKGAVFHRSPPAPRQEIHYESVC